MSASSQSQMIVSVAAAPMPSRLPKHMWLYAAVTPLALLTVLPCLWVLWASWTGDALKSIGIFVPPVCFVLILRAWRKLGWRVECNWWGLALIVANAVLGWIQLHSVLLLVLSTRWTTVLPPVSLPLVLCGAGVVLMFGGTRLFRAALFPICFLWFANPVPRAFSVVIDMPLQTLSAHIARSLAIHLGQPLTPDHLRLMFTPEFGMFIAPGCNGIRGSITMALIAVVAGYIYRFRWYTNAAVVAGAVLLGYLFNLFRLSVLVLYYILALHVPTLQDKAETADYIIGGSLFLLASSLLFTLIHRLRDAKPVEVPISEERPQLSPMPLAPVITLGITACLAAAAFASSLSSHTAFIRSAAERFPSALGPYTLVRTWDETLETGVVVYQWAEYAMSNGTPVAIGISPELGWHDPLICHTIRGEHPVEQGPMLLQTAEGSVNFNSAQYFDGETHVLEASTQCAGGSCDEFATARTHFGLIYTRLDRDSLFENPARSLPVVVRAELPNDRISAKGARMQLSASVMSFINAINLAELTRP